VEKQKKYKNVGKKYNKYSGNRKLQNMNQGNRNDSNHQAYFQGWTNPSYSQQTFQSFDGSVHRPLQSRQTVGLSAPPALFFPQTQHQNPKYFFNKH